MHLHLPKPLHGWREFAGEVGVIVLGVLIAIALEQAVEAIHWQAQVRDARGAIAEDMAQTNRAFAFRVARSRLHRGAAGQTQRHHRAIGDPSAGAARRRDHAGHRQCAVSERLADEPRFADPDSLRSAICAFTGLIMSRSTRITGFITHEVDDLTVLEVLQGDPGRLGPSDISGLRVAVRRATFDNDLSPGSHRMRSASKSLGVACRAAMPNAWRSLPAASAVRAAACFRPSRDSRRAPRGQRLWNQSHGQRSPLLDPKEEFDMSRMTFVIAGLGALPLAACSTTPAGSGTATSASAPSTGSGDR